MNRLWWLAAALGWAMGVSFSCASPPPPRSSAVADRTNVELDIQEAVFRYQLDHDPVSPKPRTSDFVLLSLAELRSPAPELVARFADQSPPVDAVSELRIDSHRGIRHKTRPGKGMILMVTSLRRLDDHRFDVDGELRWGSHGASGSRYRLEHRGSVWVVVGATNLWMT